MNLIPLDLNYYGQRGLITSDLGELVTDYTGLSTATAQFKIQRAQFSLLPKMNTAHPVFTFLGMSKRRIYFDGPWACAQCDYGGFDPNEFGDFTAPVYELACGTEEEPIETHPKFATADIAGTPSDPKNGAIFRHLESGALAYAGHAAASDDGYVFHSFKVGTELYGIERYLDAGTIIWRKTQNFRRGFAAILNSAGKIDTPEGPAPNLASPRNWLNMGTTTTIHGSAEQAVTEWRASGKRGWNTKIYG